MNEEDKQDRAEQLKGEITERLIELAEINGPEDTMTYVQSLVSRMREEIAAMQEIEGS